MENNSILGYGKWISGILTVAMIAGQGFLIQQQWTLTEKLAKTDANVIMLREQWSREVASVITQISPVQPRIQTLSDVVVRHGMELETVRRDIQMVRERMAVVEGEVRQVRMAVDDVIRAVRAVQGKNP